MAGINLLPWRAERRKQRQQEFFALTGLVLLFTAAVLYFVHFHISGLIDYQNERNQFLQREIALLDQKIKEIDDLDAKKRRLLAKMEIIQQLQSSRPEIVHLFDQLARTIPDGVFLLDLAQAGKIVTMNGMAQSNARISAYMRNFESSSWFKDPLLSIIETKLQGRDPRENKMRGSRFTLQVKQATDKNNNEKAGNPGKKRS